MLEILQFIFSSFWIWIGFTIILSIILYSTTILIDQLLQLKKASVAVIRKEVLKSSLKDIQDDIELSSYHKVLMAEFLIRMSKNCKKLSDSEIKLIIDKAFEIK